jgi:NTP pyrophosphatase (non-canonical NTP hydrolase)
MALTFDGYSKVADTTAVYPGSGEITGLCYAALGLNGEAGEVAEKVKKLIRDKGGVVDDEFRAQVQKELGDVLWYLNALCKELDLNLEDAAQGNLEKLLSRKARGVLKGSGDNR